MAKSSVPLSRKQVLSHCLVFLTPTDVLQLADGICHEVSAAMACHETDLWTSLVSQMFPDAPFASISTSSSHATPGKVLFRLLAHASTSLSTPHDAEVSRWKCLCRGTKIVPILAHGTAPEQLSVQINARIFQLSLGNAETTRCDGVLLRENVQDVRLVLMQHGQQQRSATKSKLSALKRSFSKRIATKKRESKPLTPTIPVEIHAGVLVLTESHVILKCTAFEAGVWFTPLDDLEDVAVTQGFSQLVIEVNQQTIVMTTSSLESANGWTAALELLKQHRAACKVQSGETVSSSAQAESPNKHLVLSSVSKESCSSAHARVGSFPLSMPRAISTLLPLVSSRRPKLHQIEQSSSGVSAQKSGLSVAAKTMGLLSKTMSFSFSSRHRTTRVFLMPPEIQSRRPSESLSRSFSANWEKSKRVGGSKRSSHASTIPSERSVVMRKEDASRSISSFAPCIGGGEDEPRVVDPVHLAVYRLLDYASGFEGQVCRRFLSRTTQFQDLSSPAICRAYLIKVRDCIQDLVRFMLTFRLNELQGTHHRVIDDASSLTSDDRLENSAPDEGHRQYSPALAARVQFAVESYFCSDRLRLKLEKWCCVVANGPQKAFEHKFAHWGMTLCASSLEFGLKNPNAAEQSHSMKLAIQNLHAIGVESTPSRKVACLLEAVQALHDFIALESSSCCPPTSSKCPHAVDTDCHVSSRGSGNADELLPLFIFAVCRSQMTTPLAQCAAMRTLYPFVSQHGEHGYYVTMLETALEFVRQCPSSCHN
ncbi:hypothetical protein FI667_g10326, partial [Globisporangium splendens]